jgi:cysteine desulfurase
VFTSGGTEANNLALIGLTAARGGPPGHVLILAIEHPSIAETAKWLSARGWEVETIPVSHEGVIRLDALEALLRPETRLVSVMLANNETGVIQPVAEVVAHCRALGIPVHTDASQAVGRIEVDFGRLGVSAMTVSAHKFHGPVGIGALILAPGLEPAPVLVGGEQQDGLRPGTPAVSLAVGMVAALDDWHKHRADEIQRLRELQAEFEAALLQRVMNIEVHGAGVLRLPQTTSVAFPEVNRQALLMALDQAGIACSTGSACASGASEPAPTLVAMGCPAAVVESSLRFSFGRFTTAAELRAAADKIGQIYHALKAQKNPPITGAKSRL